jgi:hypothetical protein
VTVRLLEIAEIELDQAVQWYGAQAPGLGAAFLIEVLSAADRIARFPEAWHPLVEGVRRCRLISSAASRRALCSAAACKGAGSCRVSSIRSRAFMPASFSLSMLRACRETAQCRNQDFCTVSNSLFGT